MTEVRTANRGVRPGRFTDRERLPLVGLLLVQIFIGYEWLMSGLVKLFRGGFASGLAAELTEKSEGTVGWYKSFVDAVVIPNAQVFGYLIMFSELLAGITFIVAAVICLSMGVRKSVHILTVLAAIGGIFLNINLHLLNGSAHPWFFPGDGFDEGVDLDSLMPAIQAILIFVNVGYLVRMRRDKARQ